ncbi:hypothetical protein [Propionivibrio sp.]|uniref:hypothetical protein n=1 Tax=Propionivibrio sp. TaxID=2212460 RepID=UPI003BF33FAB
MYQVINADADHPATLSITQPKFPPGRIVATPGALAALEEYGCTPLSLLARHLSGDWGSLPVEDARLNEDALKSGDRLQSSYPIGPDTRIWILTEWDRSVSTLLLPSEY